jgi:endonuclease YncB( thermonuclease family)
MDDLELLATAGETPPGPELAVAHVYRATPLDVVDADTIEWLVDRGFDDWSRRRLELAGADAPERKKRGAARAIQYARAWLAEHAAHAASHPRWPYLLATSPGARPGAWKAEVVCAEGHRLADGLLALGLATPVGPQDAAGPGEEAREPAGPALSAS